jgi:proton-dependent oligopeptide transporter, POT family
MQTADGIPDVFFAVFALIAALVFGLYARSYRVVDNYRSD